MRMYRTSEQFGKRVSATFRRQQQAAPIVTRGKPGLQLGNTTASCVTRCDSVAKPKAGEKVDDINFCLILINRVEVFCRLCFPMFHFYFAVSDFCKLHFFHPHYDNYPLNTFVPNSHFLFLSLSLPFIVLH